MINGIHRNDFFKKLKEKNEKRLQILKKFKLKTIEQKREETEKVRNEKT